MSDNSDALVVRYLQETCTDEERIQFFSWLNEDDGNEVLFHEMKEIFDSRKRILAEKVHPVQHVLPAQGSKQFRVPQWMRYAAVIAVMLGVTSVFYLSQRNAPVTYMKQMVVHNTRGVYPVTLPDGSKVWLHGGTTLSYPEKFSDSLRMVDLQGEAYFAVQADPSHPFAVQTPTAIVRATGTEFNITAYPTDQMTTTTLVKGSVDIQPNYLKTSIELKPNQQARIGVDDVQVVSKTQRAEVKEVQKPTAEIQQTTMPVMVQDINAGLFTDWKEGVYRFRNEPFRNIVLRLEKMYGMDIRIECPDLEKASFSGMFTTDYSLKEVFEIINLSQPISYTVKDKVIYIKNKK